jgi:hypothetical protein
VEGSLLRKKTKARVGVRVRPCRDDCGWAGVHWGQVWIELYLAKRIKECEMRRWSMVDHRLGLLTTSFKVGGAAEEDDGEVEDVFA